MFIDYFLNFVEKDKNKEVCYFYYITFVCQKTIHLKQKMFDSNL